MEIWKGIKEYPRYEVSNLGRIRTDGIKIKEWDSSINKYITIRLTNECHSKFYLVHILVIEAFIDRPDYECEVNHKDCIKSNNKLDNLEYSTKLENMIHAKENGRMKKRSGKDSHMYGTNLSEETKAEMKASHNKNGDHPNYILSDSQVFEIKKRRCEGEKILVLANEFNQTKANISLICSGKRRSNIAPEYTMKS